MSFRLWGRGPRPETTSSDEIRCMIRDIAQEREATLVTSDQVMAETAMIRGSENQAFEAPS